MKILLVEDDMDWRETLRATLHAHGHEVVEADGLQQLSAMLDAHAASLPDVLILDAGLPDGDGIDALPTLRQRLPDMGIVVLTGRVRNEERINGLMGGADHFLSKPIRPDVLLATLSALQRRMRRGPVGIADETPAWQLRPADRVAVTPDGARIVLTEQEARVLARLVLSPFTPVRREVLIRALDGSPDDYDPHRLESLISRLRRKLAPPDTPPLVIRSAYRLGYLCATTVTLRAPSPPPPP